MRPLNLLFKDACLFRRNVLKFRMLKVASIAVSVLFFGGIALGADTITVKVASVAPSGTPWMDTMVTIKKKVESDSAGQIKVKLYPGGQLGGENEIIAGVRKGRIQVAGITAGAMANIVPELNVLELPYLFDNLQEADYILDNHLYEPVKELLAKKGFILVSWAENGYRNIGSKNKLVKLPEDLKGIKIRSQESKVHLEFWKKVGASAVPIAVPEVLPALQTGVVDSFDNTPLFTLAAEWQTTIKYFTYTQHIYQPGMVVVSKTFFDSLSPEMQKVMMGDGNGIAKDSRAGVRALDSKLLSTLKKTGVETYTPSSSELQQWKGAAAGLDKVLVGKLGGESRKIYDLILKGKQAYKSGKR